MSLSEKLFKDGLFPVSTGRKAPKNDAERDDESIAISDDLIEQLPRYTRYPEIAILSLVRVLAEMVMIVDKDKRGQFTESVCDTLRQAVQDVSSELESAPDADEDDDDDDEDYDNDGSDDEDDIYDDDDDEDVDDDDDDDDDENVDDDSGGENDDNDDKPKSMSLKS